MALEPLTPTPLPVPPTSGILLGWATDMVRALRNGLDRIVRRVNQTVVITDNQTISGEKTFTGVTRITNVLHGPRRTVVTKGAGSSQPAVSDSHAFIVTDGVVDVPNVSGWEAVFRLAGDHDFTFNGTTCDVSLEGWGTGDILKVEVENGACRLWRLVAAADLGAFS